MAKDPVTDLVTYLGANLGSLTKGTNLFHGPERETDPGGDIPSPCVFAIPTGGPAPRPFLSGGSKQWTGRYRVQVIVRSDQEGYGGGLTLAKSIHDTLHLATITNWYHAEADQPGPVYIGKGENDLHRFSLNFTLWGTT